MKLAIAIALSILSIIALFHSSSAEAADAKAMEAKFTKWGCFACHRVDIKLVGPAYLEVSKKYKGQKDLAAKLLDKVKKGGQGVWGPVPMTPNAHVPEAELKEMIAYIISLAGAQPAAAPAKK